MSRLPKSRTVLQRARLRRAGDGVADDTAAFQRALAESAPGVLLVPRGRYRLAGSLTLTRSRQVLRGEGSGAGGTTLLFSSSPGGPQGTIRPSAPTSFSWSGGLVQIQPQGAERRLSAVTLSAHRADRRLRVADARAIRNWRRVFSSPEARTSSAPRKRICWAIPRPRNLPSLVARLASSTGLFSSQLGRGRRAGPFQPLRTDVQMEMGADRVQMPVIREVGIEHLAIEFRSPLPRPSPRAWL